MYVFIVQTDVVVESSVEINWPLYSVAHGNIT